jgi:hypothetical protein
MLHTLVLLIFAMIALAFAVSLGQLLLSRRKRWRPTKLSPLVTGNGFGFAVLSASGEIAKWYAHPYRFQRPSSDITQDGVPTANLVRTLSFGSATSGLSPAATNVEAKRTRLETARIGYVDESHIISAATSDGTNVYFMPFDLSLNALIAMCQDKADGRSPVQSGSTLHVQWAHEIAKDETRQCAGRTIRVLQFAGIAESVVVVPLSAAASVDGSSLAGNAFALLCVEDINHVDTAVSALLQWQNDLPANELLNRELVSLESWRIDPASLKPALTFASPEERRLFRQSETILRMSQCREPTDKRSSNGLLTASLPDGVFFIHWVRDMVYATTALIHMGHHAEARQALLGLFNARPVGINQSYARGIDYQISLTRYFGDGTEEDDYGGLPTPNIEFDDWGLALWALAEYVLATNDASLLRERTYRGNTVYQSARDFVVRPLLANLDPFGQGKVVAADSSLWEESQINKRHHAFATTAAIRGLTGMLSVSALAGDGATTATVARSIVDLVKGFRAAFIHDGVLRGTVEESFKNEIDGSLLEAMLEHGLVDDPLVIERTLDKMKLLLTASGGYRRVRGTTQYERQEFLFINFLMAILYYRLGRTLDGDGTLFRMVEKACADNGLIPEMYVSEKNNEFVGEIGDPTGAIPMVGYGAGMYILALLERAKQSA